MKQRNTTNDNRLFYLDLLRVLGTLAVILAHTAGQNLSAVAVLSQEWKVFRITDLSLLWAVPVFVMISGALFLDNDRPLELGKLYRHNIGKILIAFGFWAMVYALEKLLMGKGWKAALTILLEGRYHMWYLFLIVGLYIATPLLRRITASKELTEYFLLVFFLIRMLLPELCSILSWLALPHTASLVEIVRLRLEDMSFSFVGVYTFYYVLGYYLAKFHLPKKLRLSCYAAGVLAWLLGLAAQLYSAQRTLSGSKPFDYTLLTAATTAALFLLAKEAAGVLSRREGFRRTMVALSGLTFGVYLVHPLVLSQLRDTFGLTTLTFRPVVSLLLLGGITTAASFTLSWLLHKIPGLGKYVV